MTRQERRRKERLGLLVKDLGMNKLSQLGFYYKGAGITLVDEDQIKDMLSVFDSALPDYAEAIKKEGQSEIDFYYNQIDYVRLNFLDKNIHPGEDGVIFMMNIYCLTKLGILKDDSMNGLQYAYTK